MVNIVQAKNFAKKKHVGQLRKNGKTTTFSHLQNVVKNLKKMKVTNEDIECPPACCKSASQNRD